MNIMQVAVLLIRLSSLSWFIEAGIVLTYLPNDLYGVRSLPAGYYANQRELEVVMKLIRSFIYGALGMVFNIYAFPMAKRFTRGLEGLQPQSQAEDTWPPAPRSVSDKSGQ